MEMSEQDEINGMIHYFNGKLGIINYNMAIHEGNANRRLASQAENIYRLPQSAVPENYKKEYSKLHTLIESTLDKINVPGLIPVRLNKIKNSTASKYIKLLWEIEDELKHIES